MKRMEEARQPRQFSIGYFQERRQWSVLSLTRCNTAKHPEIVGVRNFRGSCALPADAARLSLTLCYLLALSAFGGENAPLPFACEVHYHFREHFRDAKPGQKSFSAPSHEREALPVSRGAVTDGSTARIVEGEVAHLPYHFLVKVSRSDRSAAETLEINIVDRSGKPVAGFPQVMPNPLTKAEASSRKEFEIPVNEAVKKNIEKTLLEKNQLLTHVDLIVGMDDDSFR